MEADDVKLLSHNPRARSAMWVAPTVLSDTLSWSLPALALVENRDAFIRLAIPDVPLGTRYPLSLTIAQGSSTTPDDSAALELMAAKQVSMPLVVFR